jgi:hypothetical protein
MKRACLDCGRPTEGSRCQPCRGLREAARDAGRGTREQRGYGPEHAALRRKWAARIAANQSVPCARCGQPIVSGQLWQLDHDDHDRSQYLGPSHQSCNITAANRRRAENPAGF